MDNPFHSQIAELFESKVDDFEEYGLEPKPSEIEHESRDGFIPYTDGGWSLMVMNTLSSMRGSGETYAEPANTELENAIDYSLECVVGDFINDNLEELASIYEDIGEDAETLREVVSYHDLYDKGEGELAEKLSEIEDTYLSEGGEFWLVLRASYYSAENYRNESGEDEIYFHAGVNTDFQYGRDKGLVITFDKTVKVSELISGEVDLESLVDEMADSIKGD